MSSSKLTIHASVSALVNSSAVSIRALELRLRSIESSIVTVAEAPVIEIWFPATS